MFDPLEAVVSWASDILDAPVMTYPDPPDGASIFGVVTRTGGDVDWPHDWPSFAIQVWAESDAEAEQGAYLLAIGAKTRPPADAGILEVMTPSMYSYGREDGGWYVWQTTIPLAVNLNM